jgi:hypothetical protein
MGRECGESRLNVLKQPCSTRTWEVELRPWVERFQAGGRTRAVPATYRKPLRSLRQLAAALSMFGPLLRC